MTPVNDGGSYGLPVRLPKGFAFLSGFPPLVRRRRVLVPIQVCVDDSGGDNPGFQVMAGLIGPYEAWDQFSELWAECLARSPRIAYFKMQEAANCRAGEFSTFSPEMRDGKLRELIKIIDRFGFQIIYVVIDVAAFKDTIGKYVSSAPLDRVYHHAFHYLILAAYAEIATRGMREPFELIFDDTPFKEKVRAWYPMTRLMVDPVQRVYLPADVLFRDDVQFMPLQAADLVAWVCRREVTQGEHQFGWLYEELTNTPISHHSILLGRKELEDIVRESYARERRVVQRPDGSLAMEAQFQAFNEADVLEIHAWVSRTLGLGSRGA